MTYPHNLETKLVTGQFADLYEDSNGDVQTRPRQGYVYITPYYSEIKLIDSNIVVDLYELQRQRVKMIDGQFTAEVLVTNQPNISPGADASGHGWTYKFELSWIDGYEANIPIDDSLADIIDLNDWTVFPARPGVIVTKGEAGRGILNVTANGITATVTYTDGTTSQFQLPDPEGGNQYIWSQNTAQADWTITHNLNRYITACFVTYAANIDDPTADQIMVPWTNVDKNTIVIHHGAACSGQAVLI